MSHYNQICSICGVGPANINPLCVLLYINLYTYMSSVRKYGDCDGEDGDGDGVCVCVCV